MKTENESKIQQEIVQYIRKTYCKPEHSPRLICISVPNGIGISVPPSIRAIVNKAIAIAMEKAEQIGMYTGASDLQVHGVNGRCLHLEVKTGSGSQSPDQIKFQKRIENLGGRYKIVRSLDDVEKINFDWLIGKE